MSRRRKRIGRPNAIRQGRLAMINHVIKDRYRYRDDYSERDRDRSDRGRTQDKARDRDQGSDRSRDTEASKEEDKSKDKRGHDNETKNAVEPRFTRFSSNSAEQNNFPSL